jgi:hypothetical protein
MSGSELRLTRHSQSSAEGRGPREKRSSAPLPLRTGRQGQQLALSTAPRHRRRSSFRHCRRCTLHLLVPPTALWQQRSKSTHLRLLPARRPGPSPSAHCQTPAPRRQRDGELSVREDVSSERGAPGGACLDAPMLCGLWRWSRDKACRDETARAMLSQQLDTCSWLR